MIGGRKMSTERQFAVFLIGILLSSVFVGIQITGAEGKDGSFGGGAERWRIRISSRMSTICRK